jgi:SAM-dependent methyltransferase
MQDLRLFDVARSAMMKPLSFSAQTRAAYERWAPLYPPVAHNSLMRAEEHAMCALWPEVAGRSVLDLACGTGRYARLLVDGGAAHVVAMDFCPPMLGQVTGVPRVCASMMHLPFIADAFDVVVSGLALGHATSLSGWMAEIARVLKTGGTVLYSDFHPEAARAELPRTFKDRNGRAFSVPHHCYEVAAQREAAAAAGLTIDTVRELRLGLELDAPAASSADFARRWHGLAVVLIVRARK